MASILDFKSVFDFAIDAAAIGQLEDVARSHGLPVERAGELQTLVAAVLKGEVELGAMPQMIAAAFGVEEEKAKQISADVAGYRLLPLQLYLPAIKQVITDWGGNITSYPSTIVPKEKITPEELIAQFAKKIDLELPEPLMKRFVYLCRGYLMGDRTREGTMVLFKRPVTIGGLEMSDTQTLTCLDMLDAQKENVEVVEMELGMQTEEGSDAAARRGGSATLPQDNVSVSQEAVSSESERTGHRPVPTAIPVEPLEPEITPTNIHHELVKTVTQAITTSVPTISGEMIAHEEKKDLEVAKKKIASERIVAPVQPEEDPALHAALLPALELFKKRRFSKQDFSDLASAHLRGRREYAQTESLLKDRFGFTSEEIEVIMKALEAGRKTSSVASSTSEGDGASGSSESSPIYEGGARRAEGVTDASVLDARFAALTNKIPDVPIEPIMPTARVSASRSKEEELMLQAKKIDPLKTAQAQQASKPEKATVLISAASAPIASRPSSVVTDVSYVTNLIGPVEEIGSMTPEQFRRLSSDPMEAIRKLEDKLALLETLSYADRIRGVEAWRKSPISLLYLSMSRAALGAGISFAELAAKQRAAGEETLSPAEISAIVELNRRVGF